MVKELLILEASDRHFYPTNQVFEITDPVAFQKRVDCALDRQEKESPLLKTDSFQKGFRLTCLGLNTSGETVFEMTHGAAWADLQIITDVCKTEWPDKIGLKAIPIPPHFPTH